MCLLRDIFYWADFLYRYKAIKVQQNRMYNISHGRFVAVKDGLLSSFINNQFIQEWYYVNDFRLHYWEISEDFSKTSQRPEFFPWSHFFEFNFWVFEILLKQCFNIIVDDNKDFDEKNPGSLKISKFDSAFGTGFGMTTSLQLLTWSAGAQSGSGSSWESNR